MKQLRNIGIIAHIDAGKTTTTERILYFTGISHNIGEVDEGSTQMDWMEQERERGITITSAATRFSWRDHEFNLIDTPGHVDFTAEVERSLRVLDGVIVVLCGVGGVEPQSEMVWRQADRYRVPRLVFVNKMDRLGASFESVVREITDKLGATPLVLNFPVGSSETFDGVIDIIRGVWLRWDPESRGREFREEPVPKDEKARFEEYRNSLLESVASCDDAILAAYLAGDEIPHGELRAAIRRGTLDRSFVPVLSGASLRNQGIQPLLEAAVDFLPAPDEVAAPVALRPESGERVGCPPDPSAPMLALVFKTHTDRDKGRQSYLRIYSGTIREGMSLRCARFKEPERIARLFRVHADKRKPLKLAEAGDIVLATGLKNASTGDTLCEGEAMVLEGLAFPEPVVSAALEASTAGDEEKIQVSLQRLAGDDPTFTVRVDENTGQTLISGMGELHLQVLEDRLVREFGLKIRVGKPQVTYRESITRTEEAESTYDRHTGGRQHFGGVRLRISPRQRGTGNSVSTDLGGDRLPVEMLRVVEAAVRDAAEGGIRYGYPAVDVDVLIIDAFWNEHTSTDLAFRIATQTAFREGCRNAGPILLEPVMSLEIVVPREFVGGVMSNLSARRGRIVGSEMRDDVQILKGQAPLSQMFGYATDLRSASQGRGTYSMLFSHYDEVQVQNGFVA